MQALAAQLTQTEHRERRRLAQILHDHLQQLLYAARLDLETLRRRDSIDASAQETIDRVDGLLGECIAESRSLTVQLCPPVLHEAGLAAAVEWLGRHMEQTCGLNVEIDVDPQAEPESEEIRILLFEAVRELLFNVVKHAETGRARRGDGRHAGRRRLHDRFRRGRRLGQGRRETRQLQPRPDLACSASASVWN